MYLVYILLCFMFGDMSPMVSKGMANGWLELSAPHA
jgi:hypothetical protein